jgi:hypothetical protein
LRKWAFFVLATAAVIIGCAGGGDSGGTGSTGTTSTTSTTGTGLAVSIPTPPHFSEPPGTIDLGYLTGQGRAVGDLTLEFTRAELTDEFGTISGDLNTRLDLALGSYTFQTSSLLVPFNGENSRLFESYSLDPTRIGQDQGGSISWMTTFAVRKTDGSVSFAWPPDPIQIEARVFPGRNTLLPIYIDDSMFSIENVPIDPSNPDGESITAAVFDEQRFTDINQPPLKGFINDYVSFDISAMPNSAKPRLSSQSGSTAVSRVFLTGDNYAVSGAGDSGAFEVLTLFADQPIVGTFRIPSPLPGRTTPGTFTLSQLDPTDLFNLRKIIAVQGIWRPYETVISGFDVWNMVAFPTSQDGFTQEVVYFKRDGSTGQIVDFYFGYLDYDTDSMHLFPVAGLVNGSFDPGAEVVATISGQFDKYGATTVAPQETRTGTFSITTRGGLPADAPGTGSFLVFRI